MLILGPLLAFALGWLIFSVPTPAEVAIPQVATISYADGTELAKISPGGNVNRVNVRLDQIPPHVQNAVLAAEDRSFRSNPGFDIAGIGRAVWNQITGGSGGGSTITQQYIKVTTKQDDFSLWRKYREIVLAAKISKDYSKEQILENYLNTIYFGRGAHGIQAASQAYFDKTVEQLTVSEGAMLAGLIQAPSRWDPAKDAGGSSERWNFVLDGMVSQGWLPAGDRQAQQFPQWVPPKVTEGGIPEDAKGHIYTQVKRELEANGISEQVLNTEGLRISTTIDPKVQQQAEESARRIMKGQPTNLRASLVAVDPRTGGIVAYYGGENGRGYDYAQVVRQPGSSFKPFAMAAALEQNPPIGLGETFDGTSPRVFGNLEISNSESAPCPNCSLKTAMTESVNTIFYDLVFNRVGPGRVADVAHRAGIPGDLLPNPTGGIALGDKEVHPTDMAAAFGTFANDGRYFAPHLITRVETADGRVLFERGTDPGKLQFNQQVARNVTESMTDVAGFSGIPLSDGRPVAAKTGTVQHRIPGQNNDAWTVGYTPQLSAAVWIGSDDNTPIKTAAGRPIFGRMLPGQIWQRFMSGALRAQPVETFSPFVPLGAPPAESETTEPPEPDEEDSDEDEDEDSSGLSGRDGSGLPGGILGPRGGITPGGPAAQQPVAQGPAAAGRPAARPPPA